LCIKKKFFGIKAGSALLLAAPRRKKKINFVFLFRGGRKRKPFCSAPTLKQKNLFLFSCGRQDGQTESPKRYFRPV